MQMVLSVEEESGKNAYVLSALAKLPDNPFVAFSALHFLQRDPLTIRVALQQLVQSINPNTERGVQDLAWLTEHHLVDLLSNILSDYGTTNENIACNVCAIVFDVSAQPKGRFELLKFGVVPKIIESARKFPKQQKLVYFVCGALGNLLWETKSRDTVLLKEIVSFLMESVIHNETEEKIVREGIRGLYNACYVDEIAEMLSNSDSWLEKVEEIINGFNNSTAHLFFQKLQQKLENAQENNLVKKISWVSESSEGVTDSIVQEQGREERCSVKESDSMNDCAYESNCSIFPTCAILSIVTGSLLLSIFAYYRWH